MKCLGTTFHFIANSSFCLTIALLCWSEEKLNRMASRVSLDRQEVAPPAAVALRFSRLFN